MDFKQLIREFNPEKPEHIDYLKDAFQELERQPHCFTGVNWHSSHDYIYVSPSVSSLTGYPFANFSQSGIIFLFSITPPHIVGSISEKLTNQVAILENNPRQITEAFHLSVDGALTHQDGTVMPFRCMSTVLDYLPGTKKTYLILSSYISPNHAGDQFESLCEELNAIQEEIHRIYMDMKPSRFRVFQNFRSLTTRELEIAHLIRKGHNSRDIADQLNIAMHTVASHRKSLLRKLEVRNMGEMVHLMNQVD